MFSHNKNQFCPPTKIPFGGLSSTSSEKYHMNFYMYSQNDSDSKAVGLYKIEIALESEVAIDFHINIFDIFSTIF